MPDYRCRLGTPSGEIVERDYTASDPQTLRRELERQDFLVLGIQRRSAVLTAISDLFRRKKKVKVGDFLVFNQQFAALIRAGLPITEALGLLIERRANPVLKQVLEDVRDRVRTGESLSEAFGAQGAIPGLYASTLASGERSGEIDTVLRRYIHYAQTVSGVRRRVIGAMVYPAILLTLLCGIIVVLLVYVLPAFQGFFQEIGSDMPWITRMVIAASDLLRGHWLAIVSGIITTVVAVTVWKRTPAGARLLEGMLYRTPVAGSIARRLVMARFSRTLATLVAGGIPLVTCLEIVGRAVETPIYRDAIETITFRVREGAALWASMEESGLFPEMMVEMVKVGESSGALAEMLEHVAEFNDEEISVQIQRAESLVEPLMLVAMAVVVGVMLLAIYYPLLSAYANSSQF